MQKAIYDPFTVRKKITQYTVTHWDGTTEILYTRPAQSRMLAKSVEARSLVLEASLKDFMTIAKIKER